MTMLEDIILETQKVHVPTSNNDHLVALVAAEPFTRQVSHLLPNFGDWDGLCTECGEESGTSPAVAVTILNLGGRCRKCGQLGSIRDEADFGSPVYTPHPVYQEYIDSL